MVSRRRSLLKVGAATLALTVASMQLLHCGGQSLSARDGGNENDATVEAGSIDDGSAPNCICLGDASGTVPTCDGAVGWQCRVDTSCSSGSPTTLTGKVFDPAGANPLYNAVVFIPNDPAALPAINPGTNACTTCDVSIGPYVVAAATDASGTFTLQGVPTGVDVPVTVQIGKWRRTVAVNITKDCGSNSVTDGVLRLPRKKSEGDMPQMALLTGGCDDLGCFLTNVGIDPVEFSAPHGGGRVDVYQGLGTTGNGAGPSVGVAGDCTSSACPLWASKQSLESYDTVLLSCECGENNQTKPPAAMQALHDWLDEGGYVFASHFQYTWFKNNPQTDFQNVATWLGPSAATGSGAYDVDTIAEGQGFGDWLGVVGALDGAGSPPALDLANVATSVSTVNGPTTQWIYDPNTTPNNTKYLSFETPVGGTPPPPPSPCNETACVSKKFCGKAVFADLDVSSNTPGDAGAVPEGCPKQGLTPQQKALEFLFFDEVACVTENCPPPPPPPFPQAPCDAGGD